MMHLVPQPKKLCVICSLCIIAYISELNTLLFILVTIMTINDTCIELKTIIHVPFIHKLCAFYTETT